MDSFFGIGLFELVMIAVIALLVLGPERLPGAMREVAKYMRQLRNISNEFQSQFSEELKMLDEINPRRIINEAIDPNSPAANSAKPPVQAATTKAATVAKPAAAAAAKPVAAKTITPPAAPAAPPAIANGEPTNTILPPSKTEPPPAAPDNAVAPELSADTLPPAGTTPPASVDLPPVDRHDGNGADPTSPSAPGAEDSQ
jgi:sec-independent protein translocase protein TatB